MLRRAAVIHLLFNVIGAVVFGIVMVIVFGLRPAFGTSTISSVQISIFPHGIQCDQYNPVVPLCQKYW